MQIQNVSVRDTDIRRIYFDAFPPKERMPFPLMVAMSKLWNTQFLSFYDDGIPCGFIYLATSRKLAFIMFFAVDGSLRRRGYGSAILQEIAARFPSKKLIVSIEPCTEDATDNEVRKRRKSFYQRNGFRETGWLMKLGGTVQEILIANGEFDKGQFIRFFAHYSNGTVWPSMWKSQKGTGCEDENDRRDR